MLFYSDLIGCNRLLISGTSRFASPTQSVDLSDSAIPSIRRAKARLLEVKGVLKSRHTGVISVGVTSAAGVNSRRDRVGTRPEVSGRRYARVSTSNRILIR